MGENKGLFKFLKLEGIVDNFTNLVESKIQLAKLETKEEIALILSKMTVFILLLTIGLFFVVFISFALAYYLGTALGETFIGFAVVAGIYLSLFVMLYLLRDKAKLFDRCQKILRETLHIK